MSTVTVDNLTYTLEYEQQQATLIGSTFTSTVDLIIPDTILIEDVIYTVTSINGGAFWNNQYIASVTMSNNIVSCGATVFQDCFNLVSAILSTNLTQLSSGFFRNCRSLDTVDLYVTTLQDNCFDNSGIKSIGGVGGGVNFHNPVVSTGFQVFRDCLYLTTVDLTQFDGTELGPNFFTRCAALKTITCDLNKGPIVYGQNFATDCTSLSSVFLSGSSNVFFQNFIFFRCTSLTTVYFYYPETVLYNLSRGMFASCTGLEDITFEFPNNIDSDAIDIFPQYLDYITSHSLTVTYCHSTDYAGLNSFHQYLQSYYFSNKNPIYIYLEGSKIISNETVDNMVEVTTLSTSVTHRNNGSVVVYYELQTAPTDTQIYHYLEYNAAGSEDTTLSSILLEPTSTLYVISGLTADVEYSASILTTISNGTIYSTDTITLTSLVVNPPVLSNLIVGDTAAEFKITFDDLSRFAVIVKQETGNYITLPYGLGDESLIVTSGGLSMKVDAFTSSTGYTTVILYGLTNEQYTEVKVVCMGQTSEWSPGSLAIDFIPTDVVTSPTVTVDSQTPTSVIFAVNHTGTVRDFDRILSYTVVKSINGVASDPILLDVSEEVDPANVTYTVSEVTIGQTVRLDVYVTLQYGGDSSSDFASAIVYDNPDPVVLSLLAGTGGTIEASWSVPEANACENLKYLVKIAKTADQTPAYIVDTQTTSTSYSFTELTNGTSYTVVVISSATNPNDESLIVESTPTESSLIAFGEPDAASSPSFLAGEASSSITISWNPVESNGSIVSYNLYYWLTTTESEPTILTGVTSPYLIQGLTNGETYIFMVQSVGEDPNGNNVDSTVDSNTVSAIVWYAPSSVTNLTSTQSSSGSELTVSWTASVLNGSINPVYTVSIDGVSSTTENTSYTYSNLTNGQYYAFHVFATGSTPNVGSGEPDLSSSTFAVMSNSIPWTSPSAPYNVTAIAGSNPGEIVVSWDPADANGSNDISYNLSLNNRSSSYATNITSPYTITGLTNGTVYQIVVFTRATDPNGIAAPSFSHVSEDPDLPVIPWFSPSIVQNLLAIASDEQLDVSWDAGNTNGSINVQYLVALNGGEPVITSGTSKVYEELTNGQVYSISVIAQGFTPNEGSNDPASLSSESVVTSGTPYDRPIIESVIISPDGGAVSLVIKENGNNLINYSIMGEPLDATNPFEVLSDFVTDSSLTDEHEIRTLVVTFTNPVENVYVNVANSAGLSFAVAPGNFSNNVG